MVFTDAPDFNVQFPEAIEYMRQKLNLPSKTWRDIEGRSHDRSFVVAGAMKEELLGDLRGEVEKAIAGKSTLTDFSKEFDQIVAKHGWTGWTGEDTEAGRAWRTRVIFETNLRTAYAAGRYAQMTDKDMVKGFPYWRYMHGFYRQPTRARPKHLAWDRLVLKWDDPFWKTHYPPNGWFCSCGVEVLADYDLEDEGISVDTSPDITYRTVIDPKTGDRKQVPHGIDFGWDHAPGRDWSHGLVPKELQNPLPPSGATAKLSDLPTLSSIAKPFKSKPLPAETTPDAAVDLFLAEFGASRGTPALFRDAAGHAIPISESLFQKNDGSSKANKRGRHVYFMILAEAIQDPDEIWVDWQYQNKIGKWVLVRRYLRLDKNSPSFSSFKWSRQEWEGSTAFVPKTGTGAGEAPNPDYLENQRSGALLWRRGSK
jgi:hypothetical protein